MTTTITKTVGVSGRQYTSTQAAFNALKAVTADLVASDQEWVIDVYGGGDVGGTLLINGVTTDATHRITVKAAAGQSFSDHANKATNPLRFNASVGASLSAAADVVQIDAGYVTVEGLQISGSGGSAAVRQINPFPGNIVKGCVLRGDSPTNSVPTVLLIGGEVINCNVTAIGGGTGCGSGGSTKFHNVNVFAVGTNTNYGFGTNYDTPVCTNCTAFGFAVNYRAGVTGNYNASSQASPPGANSIGNLVAANQFQDVSSLATLDLRPKSTAALVGAGTRDQAYTADLDIIKQARSTTTPTIGAMEYVAPAAATAPGAPTIGTATVGNGSASVPFTAPASDGGSAILDYLATSSLGETVTVTGSPANFTGLSAVARTFHVQARNTVGTGPASAESNSVTPTVNPAPTLTGTVANITGTGGVAITGDNVASAFTDSGDTLQYTKSPGGTAWPAGLNIDLNTAARSGTVATSTTTGCKVRATDTAGQFVDSNAFSVTIAAPTSTVSTVVLTPATATVAGGGTLAISGVVNGTGGPSQTINFTTTGGTLSSTGASSTTATLPAATGSAQTITVTGTSAQDGSHAGTCVITVPAAAVGTLTSRPFVNNTASTSPPTASLQANQAGWSMFASNLTTGAAVGTAKTNLTTSSAAALPAQTDAAWVAGTTYACRYYNATTGMFGIQHLTAT